MQKHFPLLLAITCSLVAGAWFLRQDSNEAVSPTTKTAEPAIDWQGEPPSATQRDGEAIFKKAFWRRPSETDQILHAERHEWSDEEGVNRWQWFLVVDASPELIQYLREENTFGLVPGEYQAVDQRPNWFHFGIENTTTLRSNRAGMQLVFDDTSNRLYATSSGLGFRKGITLESGDSVKVTTPLLPSGRLPRTPPPIPVQTEGTR